MTTTEKYDKANEILSRTVNVLEDTFGWETNRQTLKEGRNLFTFECMFSDDNNKVTVKKFQVSLGNEMVKELQ